MYESTRPVMTRDELARHEIGQHGRDFSRSDDGYDDMDIATGEGWHALSGWGRDGYDLGDWPYVVISVRATAHREAGEPLSLQMRVTVEGDTTVYLFDSLEDRDAAIDYLFIWYGVGKEYDGWAKLGLTSTFDSETCDYPTRKALDAGTLSVPQELRGPFSWARCDAEKSESA